MARWKLAVSHYINVPGTEWEYTENDRITGQPKRRRFVVPRLLDPNDPSCWTNKWGFKDNQEGEIIVCYEGRGESNDLIFVGDPTPDMIPVDDDAKTISASFAERWSYKPEIAEASFSQSLVDKFQVEMAEADTNSKIEVEGLSDLVSILSQSVKQNQDLIETLLKRRV